MVVEFEWDYSKEKINVAKHGYNFADAIEAFQDPDGISFEDSKHSADEVRFFWVGKTKNNNILTVWYTRRRNKIRIIGCAEWRKFRSLYYEATKFK